LPHTSSKILAVAKAMAVFFESSETKISIKPILKIIKASYLTLIFYTRTISYWQNRKKSLILYNSFLSAAQMTKVDKRLMRKRGKRGGKKKGKRSQRASVQAQ